MTGNHYAGTDGDIVAGRRPSLSNTVCEHSVVSVDGGAWGVCSDD